MTFIILEENSLIKKNNGFLYWHTAFRERTICLFLSWIYMVYEDFVLVKTHIILFAFRKLTFWLLLHNIYDFIRLPSDI